MFQVSAVAPQWRPISAATIAVGGEVGAEAAVALRHADLQQPGRAQVGVVLEREGRVAVVLRGARRELLAPELRRGREQFALLAGRADAFADDRRRNVASEASCRFSEGLGRADNAPSGGSRLRVSRRRAEARRRTRRTARGLLEVREMAGAGEHAYSAPGICCAIFSITAGGAVASCSPASASVGTAIDGERRAPVEADDRVQRLAVGLAGNART